jgi:hypothetical protein
MKKLSEAFRNRMQQAALAAYRGTKRSNPNPIAKRRMARLSRPSKIDYDR